jgi:hypothetical protein
MPLGGVRLYMRKWGLDCFTLENRIDSFSETSEHNCQPISRNIPEEEMPQLAFTFLVCKFCFTKQLTELSISVYRVGMRKCLKFNQVQIWGISLWFQDFFLQNYIQWNRNRNTLFIQMLNRPISYIVPFKMVSICTLSLRELSGNYVYQSVLHYENLYFTSRKCCLWFSQQMKI